MSNATLYDRDFLAWAHEQTELLRAGKFSEADIGHIADEIETMGRTEKRELISRLKILLAHLLKWQHQPAGRCTGWRLAIEEQRREVIDHLADNPSLQSRIDEAMANPYAGAILAAARETNLDRRVFAETCPWTFETATDLDHWPEHQG